MKLDIVLPLHFLVFVFISYKSDIHTPASIYYTQLYIKKLRLGVISLLSNGMVGWFPPQ